MLTELKFEVTRTFGREITKRGDCESLSIDILEKTGEFISYNTLRRLFGLVNFGLPRKSTLDVLSIYIGFNSYTDFIQRFKERDGWIEWENLFQLVSLKKEQQIVELLLYRKKNKLNFSLSFVLVIKELMFLNEKEILIRLFKRPEFSFNQLPYDEVAQIGVLIGMHLRNDKLAEMEKDLIKLPNFRDLVFKIFVDYYNLNGNYGYWVNQLLITKDLDEETRIFVNALHLWKKILDKEMFEPNITKKIPKLSQNLHPILFGRIFGLHFVLSKNDSKRQVLKEQFLSYLNDNQLFVSELLYEPAVQSLVTCDEDLIYFVNGLTHKLRDINNWYHLSQFSIHQTFQVFVSLRQNDFEKAQVRFKEIRVDYIRHGYREFLEIYLKFYQAYLDSKQLMTDNSTFFKQFQQLDFLLYPLLSKTYFQNYFRNTIQDNYLIK